MVSQGHDILSTLLLEDPLNSKGLIVFIFATMECRPYSFGPSSFGDYIGIVDGEGPVTRDLVVQAVYIRMYNSVVKRRGPDFLSTFVDYFVSSSSS